MKKTIVLVLLVVAAPLGVFAGKRRQPPPAPLPSEITDAKTVFLTNGGGSELAFDAFYQEFKEWGKYQLVGDLPPKSVQVIL